MEQRNTFDDDYSSARPEVRPPISTTIPWVAAAALIAVVLVAAAVRLVLINTQSIWLDEGYSLAVAHHSLGFIMSFISHYDLHPPLYYLLLHLFEQLIGFGPIQARLLSVLAGIGAILALYMVTVVLLGRLTAVCAAFLLAISPVVVWYSDEARMYMLAGCFVLAAFAFLLRAIRHHRGGFWAGYVVFAVLALYTDYSAVYPLAGAFIYSLLLVIAGRIPSRVWLVAHVVAAVLLLPVLRILSIQVLNLNQVAFIPRPTPATVGASLVKLISLHAGETALVAVIGIALAVLGLMSIWQDKQRDGDLHPLLFVVCISLAPIIVPLAISAVHPVFLTRTIMSAAFGLLIIFAAGIAMVLRRSRVLGLLAFIPLLAVNAQSLHAAAATTLNENWRAAARFVESQALPGDALLFDPEYGQLPFDVYWRRFHAPNAQYAYPYEDGLLTSHSPSLATAADMQRVFRRVRTVWLVARQFGPPAVPRDTAGTWLRQHFRLAGDQQFNGVTVFRFTTLPASTGPNSMQWREAAATVLRHVRAHDEIVLSGSGAATFMQAWATSPHPPATIVTAPARYNGTVFTPSAQTRHIWLITMPRGARDPAGIEHDWLYHHGPQVASMRTFGTLRVYEFGYQWNRP